MYLWQLCKWQRLLHFCRFSGVTFCYWYFGGSFCNNYANDCFCCSYTVRSFCSIYASESFWSKYVGDNFIIIMQMGVSVAIMQVVLSAVHYASCHCKTPLPFCLWKKRPENAFLTLAVNYHKFIVYTVLFHEKGYFYFNPLSATITKWSNTFKQFVGKLPTNCLSMFDHFVGLALEGLSFVHHKKLHLK